MAWGLIVTDWRDRAACAGEWFLMESPAFEAEAKRLCIGCPVFWQCRAEGDKFEGTYPSYYLNGGVLAGETGLERATRRRGKRQRRKSRAHS